MRKLVLTLQPGEPPVSAESVAGAHEALTKLARTVSRLCLTFAIMGGMGALAAQMKWAPSDLAHCLLLIGFVGLLAGMEYQRIVLAPRLSEVSPIPDSMLAEAAILCSTCPAARVYVDALREQKRELTLAEFDSLKRLATATLTVMARKALYD